jgi:hypothetical protein
VARTFLFFYALVLHLLVFATLWHFAHATHGECGGGAGGGTLLDLHHTAGDPRTVAGSTFDRLVPNALRGAQDAAPRTT